MKKLNKKGFTLIELLVVIAIIGLLSTLAVVAFGNTRMKARDAKRQSDLKVLQTAIEMYIADTGAVPAAGGASAPGGTDRWDGVAGNLETLLATYLPGGLPEDPSGSTHEWAYCYWDSGGGPAALSGNYMVATVLEIENTNVTGDLDSTTWLLADCISSADGLVLTAAVNCSDTAATGLIDATTGTTICLGSPAP